MRITDDKAPNAHGDIPEWAVRRARRRLDVGFPVSGRSPWILIDWIILVVVAVLPEWLRMNPGGLAVGYLVGVLATASAAAIVLSLYGRWQRRRIMRFARDLADAADDRVSESAPSRADRFTTKAI